MRILVVEDEYSLSDVIASRLRKENYEVDAAFDGEEGLYKIESGIYDLVILDVMLPVMDGFEILKKVRNENIGSKIIMLTAKSELSDKLNGLENGADDYITKPFHIDELTARVNVQLKRKNNFKNRDVITYKDLELNTVKLQLSSSKTNEKVELVRKEFQLLEYFIDNPERILTREQIYDKVWGLESESESNNLEVYLSFIRKKLKAINSDVSIKSVRGLGYKMECKNE